ncbi:MAG: plasmid pRiA4b ORF-3 family protein [Actinomycetota bacterium]
MKPGSVHQLKFTLRNVKPAVWRRIVVRSEVTLGELSSLMESAMGWLGGHLHLFDVDGTRYGTPDPDWGMDDLDEDRFRLGEVLPAVGAKMRWDYDFGDCWEHDVVVEAISPAEAGVRYPRCLAGRRACPPEDCGGSWGYAELLQALADPGNPDHAELREWAPPGFDPTRFDPVEATLAMHLPRPLEGW